MKEFLFKELGAKKGIVITLIFFILALILVIGETKKQTSDYLDSFITGFVGVPDKAILSLSPSSSSVKVGQEFFVDLMLNTKGYNVVAVASYLSYNPSDFQVVSIDTTNSIFGSEYEIINFNAKASHTPLGKIEIVKAKPKPGVNTNNGLVARIKFKALRAVNPVNDNITIDFVSAYSQNDSDVIADDGKGLDILSGVNNAKYTISDVVSRADKSIIKIKMQLEAEEIFNEPVNVKILRADNKQIVFQTTTSLSFNNEALIEIDPNQLTSSSYDLEIIAPLYLIEKLTNVPFVFNTTTIIEFPKLLIGDLNGDNIINSLDWSLMRDNWGKGNVSADLNKDGIVNAIDWSFLNKNWAKKGK